MASKNKSGASLGLQDWVNASGTRTFGIPSMNHHQFVIRAVLRSVIVGLSCLAAYFFMTSAIQEKTLILSVTVICGCSAIAFIEGRELAETLVRWRQARKTFKAMIAGPYPAGLARGRHLMDTLKSMGMEWHTDEQICLFMQAIHLKLLEEGYDRVHMGRGDVPGYKRMEFLQEGACVLTDDGGRNLDVVFDKIQELGRPYLIYVDPGRSQTYADVKDDCMAIYHRLSAAVQSRHMDMDTPPAQAVGSVTRF